MSHQIRLKLWIRNFNTNRIMLKVSVQTFAKLNSFWHNSIKKVRVMEKIRHCATFQYRVLFREELNVWFASVYREMFTPSVENVLVFRCDLSIILLAIFCILSDVPEGGTHLYVSCKKCKCTKKETDNPRKYSRLRIFEKEYKDLITIKCVMTFFKQVSQQNLFLFLFCDKNVLLRRAHTCHQKRTYIVMKGLHLRPYSVPLIM